MARRKDSVNLRSLRRGKSTVWLDDPAKRIYVVVRSDGNRIMCRFTSGVQSELSKNEQWDRGVQRILQRTSADELGEILCNLRVPLHIAKQWIEDNRVQFERYAYHYYQVEQWSRAIRNTEALIESGASGIPERKLAEMLYSLKFSLTQAQQRIQVYQSECAWLGSAVQDWSRTILEALAAIDRAESGK